MLVRTCLSTRADLLRQLAFFTFRAFRGHGRAQANHAQPSARRYGMACLGAPLVSMSVFVGFDRQLRRKRTPTQFDQLEDLPSPAEVREGHKASIRTKTFAARPLKRWISIPSSQETADPTCIGARTIACTAWQRTHVHFPRLPGERGRGCAEAGKARRPARGMRGGRADQADQCRRLACFGLPLPPPLQT